MRGSLHCAAHDEAVNGFRRDDGVWVGRGGNENARNPKGLWRLILEDLPACRPSSSPAQPCGQPAAFAADRPFSPASEPDPPAPVRLPRPRPGFAVDRRLAPPPDSPAFALGTRPPVLVGGCISGLASRSTCGLRRRLPLGPAFELDLQRLTFDLRRRPFAVCRHSSSRPSVDLWLAPPIHLPAPSSELNLRIYRLLCLRPALQPIFGLRLRSTIPLCLRTRPPALTGCRIFALGLPVDLRLAPPIDLPAPPSRTQPPTLTGGCVSGSAFRLILGFRLRSTFRAVPSNSACRFSPAAASPARPYGLPSAFA
jgi:hypothetical protein